MNLAAPVSPEASDSACDNDNCIPLILYVLEWPTSVPFDEQWL